MVNIRYIQGSYFWTSIWTGHPQVYPTQTVVVRTNARVRAHSAPDSAAPHQHHYIHSLSGLRTRTKTASSQRHFDINVRNVMVATAGKPTTGKKKYPHSVYPVAARAHLSQK